MSQNNDDSKKEFDELSKQIDTDAEHQRERIGNLFETHFIGKIITAIEVKCPPLMNGDEAVSIEIEVETGNSFKLDGTAFTFGIIQKKL